MWTFLKVNMGMGFFLHIFVSLGTNYQTLETMQLSPELFFLLLNMKKKMALDGAGV